MYNIRKEIAKVGIGFAASETLGHWWIGTFGRELLPLDLGWFTFTKEINQIVMIIWPMILIALAIYAWGLKGSREAPASFGRSIPV